MRACDTKVQGKKKYEETDRADVSLGAWGAFWWNVFGVNKGWQKKMYQCETPKSSWAVSKADEKENTWERREKDSLEKHKTGKQTQNEEKTIQTVQFAFVIEPKDGGKEKKNNHTGFYSYTVVEKVLRSFT